MIFSYDKPKSQAYRIARFEAIQHLKNIKHDSLNLNIIENLTTKIYNNESKNFDPAGVSMMIKKIKNENVKPTPPPSIKINEININIKNIKNTNINPTPTSPIIKVNPSPIIKVNPSPIIKVNPSPIVEPTPNYPINKAQTKKILVLYVYHIYNNRVKSFIENCIFYDKNIDFIIISNNKNNNNTFNVTKNKNVKMFFRNNVGYDFGGWSDALLTDNLYEKYNNFIFVNSSVIGPFLPSDYKGNWTDIYINGLQNNVKLFGSTINNECNPLKRAHVQSYIFSMDKTTLKYLIDCSIFSNSEYAKTQIDAINNQEILMSTKIIENNWNIGSLMTYYKNIDFTFRNKKPEDYNIKFLDDVMYPEYRNKIWNEYELVFIKGNRNINVV